MKAFYWDFYLFVWFLVWFFGFLLQPEASAASSPHSHRRQEEEDEGDLNKTLSVPRFQHILRPAASVPDELLHSYHEEDIECKNTLTKPLSVLQPLT